MPRASGPANEARALMLTGVAEVTVLTSAGSLTVDNHACTRTTTNLTTG